MSEANELRKPTNPSSLAEKAPESSQPSKGAGEILGDAVHAALYSAVQEPVSGVTQIVDALAGTKFLPKVQFIDAPTQAKFGSLDWHAQTVGSAVGMLLPFMLVGKGVKGVLGETSLAGSSALLSQKAVFGMSMAEAGLTGFAYDSVLRPSNPQHTGLSFLLDRGIQGTTGAATFMTLTGGSLALSKFAGSAAIERSALVPLLKNPIASGIISGIPAGLVSAEASSLTTTGHFATGQELGRSVYSMSVIGGAFGAAHMLKAPGEDGSPSRIDALTSKIKSVLSSNSKSNFGPRMGLALAGGDIVEPNGDAEHSIAPPEIKGDGKDKAEVPAANTTGNGTAEADTHATPIAEPDLNDALQNLADAWGAKFERGKPPKGTKGKGPPEATTETVSTPVVGADATKVTTPVETNGDHTKVVPVATTGDAVVTKPAEVVDPSKVGTDAAAPRRAIWHAKDLDIPVEYHGDAGEMNGQKFVYIKSTADGAVTGVPIGEVELLPVDHAHVETTVPTKVVTPADGVADKTKPDPLRIWTADDTGAALDQAKDQVVKGKPVFNPDVETVVTKLTGDGGTATEGKRSVTVPDVDPARQADLVDGIKTLHQTIKAKVTAEETERTARSLELEAADPASAADVKTNATAARLTADEAQTKLEAQRKAFADYVGSKGHGLQTELEHVAGQLKQPDAAREIVQHEFALNSGKQLLENAVSDTATAQDREAFDQFVRDHGTPAMKPELAKTAEALQNSDIARALVDRAYAPRSIDIQVEDPGQQAALNAGLKLLTAGKTIDTAALEQYAKDYGPAMENHMLNAAEQLGHATDVRLQIREAYHGEAMKEGIALLRADTIDPKALEAFAQGPGKALESQMTQSALDLQLDATQHLALREAYRGVESWVPVDGHDGAYVPVKPELLEKYFHGIDLLQKASMSDGAHQIDLVREFVNSPDSKGLQEPLDLYAEATGDRHIQALLREVRFGADNMMVTGKPEVVQVGNLLVGETPAATQDRVARFQDFADHVTAYKDSSPADLAQNRAHLYDWLNRNPDLHNAVLSYNEQSADSKVVAALDSYFGTENLKTFEAARQKYEKVAAAITPEVIARMNKSAGELFWDLAPKELEAPRMWGGQPRIDQSPQAYKVSTAEDGTVTAEFRRHPDNIQTVADQVDGTRTITYKDGNQIIQLPRGVDVHVKADGGWSSDLGNGNYIEEFATGDIQKVVRENGVDTVVYRNGAIKQTGIDGQVALKESDGTTPDTIIDTPGKKAGPQVSNADVSALVAKLGSTDYNEATTSAIWLKNSFGKMTDTEFVSWLNFAMGSHPDPFDPAGRLIPNLPDLRMRDGQILLQDNIQSMLRGGDTPDIQNSPDGLVKAAQNRAAVKAFLDAPETRPSDLEYPAWLVAKNGLPPDQLPENVLKDLRVRFAEGKVPPDVQQYLDANPEVMKAPKAGDKRGPRGPFTLPRDDVPSRLRTLSDVLEYAPKQLQEQLLSLGAADGRALRDIMQVISPPKGERDSAQPVEYKRLLELTVPQAKDIYTLKLMIQAIKDGAWANKPDQQPVQAANEFLANKAAARLMPESAKDQVEVQDLISGIISGRYRAPWTPRPREGEQPKGPEKLGSGKYSGDLRRDPNADRALAPEEEEGGFGTGDDGEMPSSDPMLGTQHDDVDVEQSWQDQLDQLNNDDLGVVNEHIDPGL